MRVALIALGAGDALAAVYFTVLKPSPAERLTQSLQEALGTDVRITLEACDLSLLAEQPIAQPSPIAQTRSVLVTDLRNYSYSSVQIIPAPNQTGLRIDRKPLTRRMERQLDAVVSAGGERTAALVGNFDSAREILDTDGGSVFFRVIAEVVQAEDGQNDLKAHADAPAFFHFAKAVEAIEAPASYRVTTTFGPGGQTPETLLTGEVVAVPFLEFRLDSEESAKALATAFYEYARDEGCA